MAEVTPADPSAQARTRARRTLIGSAILALTAVVVVPLVMDSKPRPWSDGVQLQIPSKDSKFDTPLQAPAAVPTAAVPVVPAPAGASKPAALPAPALEAKAEPKSEAKEPPKDLPKEPPKLPPQEPAKESAKEPAKSTPPAPKAAVKEVPKPAPKAADPRAGKIVLQAGAFTTEERIKAVEADLRKAGYTPYREEVAAKAGTVTRVRFTVATQQAADKAVAKLAAAGITPKIISQ